MTREQIISKMLESEPRHLFYTMELGGNNRQLGAMEDAGLISSRQRYSRGWARKRDWYMTDEQFQRARGEKPYIIAGYGGTPPSS